jgi:glycosyltransferase involved in cell wall biosynthesis
MRQSLQLKNVTFHDAVPMEKLAPFESIADAGLVSLRDLPIFEGARPSKMFPLLAAGKPLIFCGNGEGAQLIRRAKAGIVVPPENPQALAAAVPSLLGNAVQLEQFGANGRRFVEEHHDWRKLVGSWVQEFAGAVPRSNHSKNRAEQQTLQEQAESL